MLTVKPTSERLPSEVAHEPLPLETAREVNLLVQLSSIHILVNDLFLECMRNYLNCKTETGGILQNNVDRVVTSQKSGAWGSIAMVLGGAGSIAAIFSKKHGNMISQSSYLFGNGGQQWWTKTCEGDTTGHQESVQKSRGGEEKLKEAMRSVKQSIDEERQKASERERAASQAYSTQN